MRSNAVLLPVVALMLAGCATPAPGPATSEPVVAARVPAAPKDPDDLGRGNRLAIDVALVATDPGVAAMADAIRGVMPKVYAALPVDDVVVHLARDPERVIPGFGVGGWTDDPNAVWIFVDPDAPDYDVAAIPYALAHELHHAVRYRDPRWVEPPTLLEMMVTEGLADRFAVDVTGRGPMPWSLALTDDEADRWTQRARPELAAPSASWEDFFVRVHRPWFFGRAGGPDPMPPWIGYALGWRMVADHLDRHPGRSAADLVAVPATEISAAGG